MLRAREKKLFTVELMELVYNNFLVGLTFAEGGFNFFFLFDVSFRFVKNCEEFDIY